MIIVLKRKGVLLPPKQLVVSVWRIIRDIVFLAGRHSLPAFRIRSGKIITKSVDVN